MSREETTTAPPTWREPTAALRGSVVVLAGRGEGEAVYERFATRLAFDGYRVAVLADAAAELEKTVAVAAALLAERDDVPRILVGSDTGASAVVTLLAEGRLFADVAVLAGLPAAGGVTKPVAGGLDWEQELSLRSACPVHRGALERAGSLTPGALARRDALADGVDTRLASGVLVPVLALHGAADEVSQVAAALELYRAVPDAEIQLVEGGRHDILNDVTHRSVAATVVLFLERLRTPGRPPVVVPATREEGRLVWA
ncbi:alpha/beta hydrolase [Herbiconiux liukaitaii]|uniref:alpha/beta hydrolase n=1 Tax=Herbiconiux liukaitaii TaxID=3342799 RepID=UPI0035BAE966